MSNLPRRLCRYKPVITLINEMLEEFAEHADGVDYIYCGDKWLVDVGARALVQVACTA